MSTIAPPLNVLIIDDNRGDIDLITFGFEEIRVPITLSTASNGYEGRTVLEDLCRKECCPNLILLDLNMPRMNGFEFLEHIGKSGLCKSARLIVMTTSSAPHDRERSLRLGASQYINKPKTFAEITTLLTELVRSCST